MRVLQATLAVAVALGLAGAATAQSLGELADKEKQKRQGKPAPKTLTESDLARAGKKGTLSVTGIPEPADAASAAPAESGAPAPEAAAPEAAPPAEGATEAPPEGAPPPEQEALLPATKPKGPPPKTADEIQAEAKAELQKKLDLARTNLAKHQETLAKITAALDDSTTFGAYTQGRASLFTRQDEEKATIAKMQADIAQLEEDVRRSAWPR